MMSRVEIFMSARFMAGSVGVALVIGGHQLLIQILRLERLGDLGVDPQRHEGVNDVLFVGIG